ncbi:hypothetical protein K6119_19305 [Paracrocinitomix mangrovi]|uniref:hypothetical protein n=1 Tax=Paracrocinitomix mangrovi TaxID=2862509 RepID=UPI001C8E05FC|nr:hypothetical protein [Paracrocinitomix mangrovi]UKN01874.1 hypothetical protein K6119_19305 [Paracrocinitomix mangrovi]
MKQLSFIGILILMLLVQSCASSHVYSTSLHLPSKPMNKGEFQLNGSFELMPDTRPAEVPGFRTRPGACINTSIGLTQKSTMNIKLWTVLAGEFSFGGSLGFHFMHPINEKSRLYFTPRIAITSDVFEFGKGIGFNATYHVNVKENVSLYAGLGSAYGTLYIGQNQHGIGLLSNFGLSASPKNSIFYFNLELNPIYQMNLYENLSYVQFNPSIGIGWNFNQKGSTTH